MITLDLEAVFLITESPFVIFERLLKRDGKAMELDSIKKLQEEEILHANLITDDLEIPLIISKKGNIKNFEKYLDSFIK